MRDLLSVLARGQELGPLVNAFDICNAHGPTVSLDANLDEASQLMEHDGLDEIPVVERVTRRFLGLVTSRQIAQALNRVSVSLSTLATRDTEYLLGDRLSRDACQRSLPMRRGKRCVSSTLARDSASRCWRFRMRTIPIVDSRRLRRTVHSRRATS